jgi:hypothetical protein
VSSTAATPFTVHFTFDSSRPNAYGFELHGAGRLVLPDLPPPKTDAAAPAGAATSSFRIVRAGSSATVRVFLYKYYYSFDRDGQLKQIVYLGGEVTRSTIAACRVGSTAELAVQDPAKRVSGLGTFCGNDQGMVGTVSINPSPRPTPLPTELTLKVNGWDQQADATHSSIHFVEGEPLARNTALTISASTDRPLPPGWTVDVFHNGDVESPGNGSYYRVCHLVKDDTSCDEVRRGRVGPFDDVVWARMTSPTGVALYVEIDFHFNP